MPPPNPPIFRLSSDPNPSTSSSVSVFAPPVSNTSSNGLFSAASTPVAPQRSHTTPATLFAGATPGFKYQSRSLFATDSPDATPKFSLSGSGSGDSPLFSHRKGPVRGKYASPTDGDDEEDSPRIFEDDTGDEDTMNLDGGYEGEEMEETTGMYTDDGEDDDEDEDSYDLMQQSRNGADANSILDTSATLKPDTVLEPGSLIIHTEELMSELSRLMRPEPTYDSDSSSPTSDGAPPPLLKETHLTRAATSFLSTLTSHLPADPKSRLHKAHYIASLLLPLHHSRSNVPETLRHWLTTHKPSPTRAQLTELKSFHPNCVASPSYWPTLHQLILRGELQEALTIVRASDWGALSTDAPATTAPKLAQARGIDTRYSRGEIDAVKTTMATAARLLASCPGMGRSSYASGSMFPSIATAHGTRAEWRIWQGSVYAACEELRSRGSAAEDDDDEGGYAGLRGGSFGMRGGRGGVLPAEVARGLRGLYEVMRGERDAVIAGTGRWEDAVCGIMFWGAAGDDESEDEDDEDMVIDMKSLDRTAREKELLRLRRVTESVVEELPLDPTAELQLAAGAVMTWDTSVISDILARFSLLVASAVVEICGWAGSIERVLPGDEEDGGRRKRRRVLDGFDDDEIAVLGMRSEVGSEAEMADVVCRAYACGLCAVGWVDEGAEFEGWEAGVGVLERVRGGREIAGKLLTQLELTSKARVEKLLTYCNENNLTEEASDIAASFASHLTSTTSHGDALHFYSLSPHHRHAIHTILTSLLTSSLLTSSATPTTPDPTLSHLLSSPTSTTSPILRFELSGYATLRTFYALRDAADFPAAARALVAAIKSAGEKFDGGVLDADWESAIETWMLGALLGELLPFLGGEAGAVLGVRECCDVMKVVTDFEVVGGEVLRGADEFLRRVLEARGGGGAGVGGVQGSSWEEVREGIDKGVLCAEGGVWRRWDWRGGFEGGVKEVVAVVRLRLSREVARAWLME